MLTRLYIDNYKCFSNFEYRPGKSQLLLGRNGSGKSSVLDVIGMLQAALSGGRGLYELTDANSLTRWDDRTLQTFELDLLGTSGTYRFVLALSYDDEDGAPKVAREELSFAAEGTQVWRMLFSRSASGAELHGDDGATSRVMVLSWGHAAVGRLEAAEAYPLIRDFQQMVERLYCLRVDPSRMLATSESEARRPDRDMANYASWYRHLSQQYQKSVRALWGHLEEAIDGFDGLSLVSFGDKQRVLKVVVRAEQGKASEYELWELSDGQRALIALYTLAAYAATVGDAGDGGLTLCLDEPENYLALAELQPWLMAIDDIATETDAQVLIASHHPELINHYAHSDAVRFYREHAGPVRLAPFTGESCQPLLPSEIVARGWEDER